MKVTIIGGGGRVGSCAAFALQCAGLVADIQILDANKDMAEGEALDLLHGSAFAGDQKIYSGDYTRAADSELFLITAGLRRKPDESRLDLIHRNVVLFVQILDSIKSAGVRNEAHVFVVSNPVDILTQLSVQRLGLPWQQVYGLGTMLDTSRFSSFIADELKELGSHSQLLHLERIMREGTGADRQLAVWEQTGDLKAVVDHIVTETYEGFASALSASARTTFSAICFVTPTIEAVACRAYSRAALPDDVKIDVALALGWACISAIASSSVLTA